MLEDNIQEGQDIRGKNSLLIWIDCFNNSIKIPTLDVSNNLRDRKQQKNITNRRKLHESISNISKKNRNHEPFYIKSYLLFY